LVAVRQGKSILASKRERELTKELLLARDSKSGQEVIVATVSRLQLR
jgi:hypothetical protein